MHDSIKALAIGGVDAVLPASEQDRIDVSFAIVNAGTRQASILQAELVAAFREADGGYSWVRMFPPIGQGFQATVLNPGEIKIVNLVTAEYAHDFFKRPRFSIPVDSDNHKIVEGLRFKSMDASGRIYNLTYVISQYEIPKDWNGGPKEYTFDCSPHELLINAEAGIPPLPKTLVYPENCRP